MRLEITRNQRVPGLPVEEPEELVHVTDGEFSMVMTGERFDDIPDTPTLAAWFKAAKVEANR